MSGSALLSEDLLIAEVGVLGSMLIDETVIGKTLLMLEDSDFQTPERRHIFQAIRRRFSAGLPVDPILINEDLGGAYKQLLADMIERTPTAANAEAYAAALKNTSRLWQLRQIGEQLTQAEDPEGCRALVDQANILFCQRSGVRRLTMEQGFREFWQRHKQITPPDYVKWGLGALDEELHVGAGDMVVIGGYPSAGKTALALQLAFNIAKGKRVGFFSYETAADKLYDRTVACQTQTSFRRMIDEPWANEHFIETQHPILSAINFMNTRGAIRMMMNTNGYQRAAWGKLCAPIIQELTSGFMEVETGLFKLSAFIPVCKAMLDLGPEWLDRYVRMILAEALANGWEYGIVCGTGKEEPIGLNRPNLYKIKQKLQFFIQFSRYRCRFVHSSLTESLLVQRP